MIRLLPILVLISSSVYANSVKINATDELECMAINIYHEARSESLAGQFAVADVVMNRVTDKRYPDTICGVVKQAVMSEWGVERGLFIPKKNMCQFSWYCDGQSDAPVEQYAWLRAKEVARDIITFRKFRGLTEGATHYHANYVKPKWSFHKKMHLIGRIGDHIFYNESF
jgi:spore germination cell wall hydrolase CwlJ-like protein